MILWRPVGVPGLLEETLGSQIGTKLAVAILFTLLCLAVGAAITGVKITKCLWRLACWMLKPKTADKHTQYTVCCFGDFEVVITQSGKRFHTNRCCYVKSANQEGLKKYAKCPTCASLDVASSTSEDELHGDFGGVGYFPGDREIESGVGN